jgi:KaiC/GvpD/RAD55 family RecA-like ATPase
MQFEDKIIANILYDEEYAFKILPYTKTDYFDQDYKIVVDEIVKFFTEYGAIPTKDELIIEVSNRRGLTDKQVGNIKDLVASYKRDDSDREWLTKNTEKFYQERSLTNAIINGASILEKGNQNTNEILKMVQDALSVSFDSHLGHDYYHDIQTRFDAYHLKEDKITTGVPVLDKITLGGFSRKSLNCVLASSGCGKSLLLVSSACNAVRAGYNVLYITLEMSEVRIAERVDANMLSVTIPSLSKMDIKQYTQKIDDIKDAKHGRMIIKEFPTSSASVLHFKNLLNELKLKQGFIPDIIMVDYINLMTSCRYKAGMVNSYGMVKAVSEELRGLAVEQNVAILTATQTNRSGMNSSDIEMDQVSDSIGLVFTLDMLFALIRTEALDQANQIMVKQLKNRYTDLNNLPVIELGINRDHMRIYDMDADPYKVDPNDYKPKRVVVPMRQQETAPNFYQEKKIQPKNDFSKFQF